MTTLVARSVSMRRGRAIPIFLDLLMDLSAAEKSHIYGSSVRMGTYLRCGQA